MYKKYTYIFFNDKSNIRRGVADRRWLTNTSSTFYTLYILRFIIIPKDPTLYPHVHNATCRQNIHLLQVRSSLVTNYILLRVDVTKNQTYSKINGKSQKLDLAQTFIFSTLICLMNYCGVFIEKYFFVFEI